MFELDVRTGSAYLQAIEKHVSHGWAVRVLKPIIGGSLKASANTAELYVVLSGDLAFEEQEGRVRYAGRAPVPPQYEKFPIFRASSDYLPGGRHNPNSWWLDDGTNVWRVGKLSPEQEQYPYLQLTPALALRDFIDCGWDPEWEFKGPCAREFREPPLSQTATSTKRPPPSFSILKNLADAERARLEILRQKPIFTSAQIEAGGGESAEEEHLLILKTEDDFDLTELEDFLEQVAETHGGSYDGNELPLRAST